MLPVNGSQVKFKTPYDHEAHKDAPVDNDIAQVKLEKTVTKEGKFCHLDQWAIVYWKAYSEETGKLTKKTNDNNKPAAFQIGHYKVSKCWEIAVQQMRAGEKATVTCPGSLVDQSADKTDDVYGKDKGRKYELEISECDAFPAYLQPE